LGLRRQSTIFHETFADEIPQVYKDLGAYHEELKYEFGRRLDREYRIFTINMQIKEANEGSQKYKG